MDEGEDWSSTPFDEEFVQAARFQESNVLPFRKPSRASLREVKREAKQRQTAGKPPRSRRRVAGVVATAAALVAAGFGVQAAGRSRDRDAGPGRPQVPVMSHLPTVQPSPDDPFAGTVVAGWPVGDAGLASPPTRAVGRFAAAQVGDAFRQARLYLHAALLDERVLYREDMEPVFATMRADSVSAWKRDLAARRAYRAQLATRFRPDVVPDRRTVKVNGIIAAKTGTDGRLWVEYTYVAAYVLRPATDARARAELVAVRREGALLFDPAGRDRVSLPWVRPTSYTSDHSDCHRKWPHPDFVPVYFASAATSSAEPATRSPGPLPTWNMTDPRQPNPAAGCFENTGNLN